MLACAAMIASLRGGDDRALTAVAMTALVVASLLALHAGDWAGWLHILSLIVLFAVQTFLLARIVRLRGGSPALGRLVTATAWAQVNTYAWSTLYLAGITVGLMGAFLMLAIVMHHRAVRLASQERSAVASLALAVLAASLALISREEAVLLPLVVAWLEAVRWRRLGPSARRAARASWIAISLPVVAYVALRMLVPTFSPTWGPHDAPQIAPHWVFSLALAVLHLGALPIVAALLTRVLYPAAWLPAARRGEAWVRAREGVMAGAGWAVIAALPMLANGRQTGLLAPGLAVAFAVAQVLEWAAAVQARESGRAVPAARVIAAHWVIALLATVAWTIAGGWSP